MLFPNKLLLIAGLLFSLGAEAGTIYHKGWIDFNKNGQKDIYEDPSCPIDERIEDLLSQMNWDEKTCHNERFHVRKRIPRTYYEGL